MLLVVHVVVTSSTPSVARVYVRVVLLMAELAGHGPMLDATVDVRPIRYQGRLL